jgi:malate permease and related proteins
MSAFSLLAQALPVYLIMLLGGLLRWREWVGEGSERDMMRICLWVLYPAFILDRTLGNPLLLDMRLVLPAAGLSAVLMACCFLLARALGFLIPRERGRGTFGFATGLQNYGYVAIPVTSALFHDSGVDGMLFVFTLGLELALWTVGLAVLEGGRLKGLSRLLSPPVLAIVIGLGANAMGWHVYLPEVLRDVFHQLGVCAIPLALIMVGSIIAGLLRNWRPDFRVSLAATMVRLVILPAFLLVFAKWMPMPDELRKVILVQAAMPAGVFSVVLARAYGGDPGTAVQIVVTTTFVSLLTLPVILGWGMKFLGFP